MHTDNLSPNGRWTKHAKTLQTERLLATISDANRPELEAHCAYSTTHENMSPNGLYSFARPVAHADVVLKGKPFREATPADWAHVVSVFRTLYSPEAIYNRVVNLRKHVRYLFDVDDLEKSEELGRKTGNAMEKALYVKRPPAQVVGQVLPDIDVDALVAGIKPRNSLNPPFPMEVRDRASLRTLRASGHRVSEHVSIRLHGVKREVVDGQAVYQLAMDRDAKDLKTGARTIYISEPRAVAALDAWMAIHPFRHDPAAFLWIAGETQGMRQLASENVRRLLTKAARWSGVDKKYPAPLTPHDFRHTCATEKARLGWNEYQMCQYFGWRIGSATPRVYVHLSLDDQRNLILRDTQKLAAQAAAPTTAPGARADAVNALLGLLKDAAAQLGKGNAEAEAAPVIGA